MNISIIGSGYVGLVTGACLADLGNNVVCIDNNEEKIEKLKNNEIPFYEPGLDLLVKVNVSQGRLSFSTSISKSVPDSDIIFICVGTPPLPNGEANLKDVGRVMKEIALSIKGYSLIVEKSTVPVRTSEWLNKLAKEYIKPDQEFDIASNPEFLSEGSAIRNFMNPDRIVIGVNSERAATLLLKLYEPLNAPILVTDINSAELIKHASNAFLATKISFINAVANICERTNADVVKVAKGIGLDSRIGTSFLNAGIGYGGSCFPKDVSAFIQIAEKYGYDFKLLKSVQEINENQRLLFLDKILQSFDNNIRNKKIAILGLAFKPNTDDMREAASITIIKELQKLNVYIKAYDPVAINNAKILLPDIEFCNNIYETVKGMDALVILTEWEEFKYLDLIQIKKLLNQPIIIDGRNLYDPKKMKDLGIKYISIGRN